MKIKIEYKYDPRYQHPYFASTTYEGIYYSECDEVSFVNAKEKLINTLKKVPKVTVPKPEEVEI